ncbi:MAG TPA: RNA pseudouridine synthase [Spirochaetia bacterium]|nr:RNA pseudouridine synthase [Spirochaetia bacterium]
MSTPSVVLEEPLFLVVSKPAGMHTAPLERGEAGTLVAWVLERYPEISDLPGRKSIEPGLLHRLDRDTSGLVLFARTDAAFRAIMAAAEAGTFHKYYAALCERSLILPPGLRELLPEPSPPCSISSGFRAYGPGRRYVTVSEPVRPEGRYETEILSKAPHGPETGTLEVKVSLARGFRHQVRVHLAASGLPILGDRLYGTGTGAEELQLAAWKLTFPHPSGTGTVEVAGDIPWDRA